MATHPRAIGIFPSGALSPLKGVPLLRYSGLIGVRPNLYIMGLRPLSSIKGRMPYWRSRRASLGIIPPGTLEDMAVIPPSFEVSIAREGLEDNCMAKTKKGAQCKNPRSPPSKFCGIHKKRRLSKPKAKTSLRKRRTGPR